MDDRQQANGNEDREPDRGPMVSGCCIGQLVALLGCIWTGASLGVRYAHGDPPVVAVGKVLLGLGLGLVAGILAAILVLWIDHVTAEWPLRREGRH
jgi:hypothetical protein